MQSLLTCVAYCCGVCYDTSGITLPVTGIAEALILHQQADNSGINEPVWLFQDLDARNNAFAATKHREALKSRKEQIAAALELMTQV